MGPLAGILAGDLTAAQEIPGSLFADVAELVKLLHGQLVGDFAPVDVVYSNKLKNDLSVFEPACVLPFGCSSFRSFRSSFQKRDFAFIRDEAGKPRDSICDCMVGSFSVLGKIFNLNRKPDNRLAGKIFKKTADTRAEEIRRLSALLLSA